MMTLPRGNGALSANPPVGVDEALSVHGSDFLWAVMAIYTAAFVSSLLLLAQSVGPDANSSVFQLVCVSLSFVAHESKRVFHYLSTMTLLVGAVCYFAQASDLGWSAVKQVDHVKNGLTRQVFWVKYVNWVVSFPSLALGLGLLSGISWTTIILNVFISWFWVLTYLAAAYTTTIYKWGFFTFGTFSWVILAMSTLNESRESAAVIGIERDYMIISVWTNILWMLYPIAFGLSDGGNLIGVTGGFIFFGVLDAFMLPVITFLFLILSRSWDWEKLNLNFSEYRGVRNQGEERILNKDAA